MRENDRVNGSTLDLLRFRRQQTPYQWVNDFLLRTNQKEIFLHAVARADALHLVHRRQRLTHQFGCRKNTHAACAKGFE